MFRILLATLLITFTRVIAAQGTRQVIRASSKIVDIRDGDHFKRGYWYIMPEKNPDYYFVEIPEKPHRVTFITDVDSISFEMEYGMEVDFIILLNGKDSCHTRISAKYRNLHPLTRKKNTSISDTLSFVLGGNDKIYLKGIVNGSHPLDIQFDLGAGGPVINKSSVEKVNMALDEIITLQNSDGINQVPSASKNILEIGNLIWDSVRIAVADNMTHREDLILGNSMFKNKIMEIDYDKKILVVHHALPTIGKSYSQHNLILDGAIPFVEGNLTFRGKTQKGWMLFDTGAYTSILNSEDVSATNKMLGEARKMIGLGNEWSAPKLNIGSYALMGFNYSTQKMKGDGIQLLLGNDLLKRFNLVLDNRNGFIYLKPNSLTKNTFSNPEYYVVRIALGLLILLIGTLVYFKMRKKKR